MDKFTKITGVAAPMPIVNVDTDMIIPKDYLKTIKRTGLGKGLFAEMRYLDDGADNPDFVLNKPAYRTAQSSSRAIISVADRAASTRPGHCSIRHSLRDLDQLRRYLLQQLLQERHPAGGGQPGGSREPAGRRSRGANATLTVDLEAMEIRGPDGGVVKFDLDEFRRHCLLNGLDDIGLTLQKSKSIDSFETSYAESRPWA